MATASFKEGKPKEPASTWWSRCWLARLTMKMGTEMNRADRHCVVHIVALKAAKEEKQWVPYPEKPWVRDPKVTGGKELLDQWCVG